MYVYNYRIFDRYDRDVVTLAVLTDDNADWRPTKFEYERWGCKVNLEFPVIKLLDYEARQEELQRSPNPFAIIVLSHLKTLSTRNDPAIRFQWKFSLVKMLYERGFSKQDILELGRFIDWIMVLPKELEERFGAAIAEYEEEQSMQYVTTFERRGIEQGLQQGRQQGLKQGLQEGMTEGLEQGALLASREAVIDILQTRFPMVSYAFLAKIKIVDNRLILKELLKKAITVQSLEEFENLPELKNNLHG